MPPNSFWLLNLPYLDHWYSINVRLLAIGILGICSEWEGGRRRDQGHISETLGKSEPWYAFSSLQTVPEPNRAAGCFSVTRGYCRAPSVYCKYFSPHGDIAAVLFFSSSSKMWFMMLFFARAGGCHAQGEERGLNVLSRSHALGYFDVFKPARVFSVIHCGF